MPIYEYVCSKCNQVTEKLQRFSDPPLKTCPHCRGRVRKQVSNSSFVLKGGGWYKDGYGSTAATATAAKKPKEAGKTGDTPASGESKPASKKKEKAAA